jgi:hypothetical protein
MVTLVILTWNPAIPAQTETAFRYEVLERSQRAAARHGLTWLAFGMNRSEARFLFEGPPPPDRVLERAWRGLLEGSHRAVGHRCAQWSLSLRHLESQQVEEEIARAHRLPVPDRVCPLASPWSSARDLLGLRRATFFDSAPLRERFPPGRLHELAGGAPLRSTLPRRQAQADSLRDLLRVAGAVRGVLPADRRCFRLFAHLTDSCGYSTQSTASALGLTTRRVRQLKSEPEPDLSVALRTLADPRLRAVP